MSSLRQRGSFFGVCGTTRNAAPRVECSLPRAIRCIGRPAACRPTKKQAGGDRPAPAGRGTGTPKRGLVLGACGACRRAAAAAGQRLRSVSRCGGATQRRITRPGVGTRDAGSGLACCTAASRGATCSRRTHGSVQRARCASAAAVLTAAGCSPPLRDGRGAHGLSGVGDGARRHARCAQDPHRQQRTCVRVAAARGGARSTIARHVAHAYAHAACCAQSAPRNASAPCAAGRTRRFGARACCTLSPWRRRTTSQPTRSACLPSPRGRAAAPLPPAQRLRAARRATHVQLACVPARHPPWRAAQRAKRRPRRNRPSAQVLPLTCLPRARPHHAGTSALPMNLSTFRAAPTATTTLMWS
jgi:hypothetical protein